MPVPVPVLVTVSMNVVGGFKLNVAVHVMLAVIVELPQPDGLQPANVEPVAAVAVSATTVLLVKENAEDEQAVPQLIPAGLLVTVPLPVPALFNVSVKVCVGCGLNVAVQETFAVIVNEPVPQPVPLKPAKTEPAAAVAVSITAVPLLKVAEQAVLQLLTPEGELEIVPLPVPALVTLRVKVWRLNVAVQVVLLLSDTLPVEQPVPDQPVKTEPAAGVAVRTIEVPLL